MQHNDEFQVSIKSITKELRKESLSVKNRLQSILDDARLVELTIARMSIEYPVIANERCGCWYVPTWQQAETCYFKSTDGHTGYWKFSSRRTNLHLLAMIIENGGIAVVDLTRKGKRFPDALLKTIPIWCAVLNYIRFDGISTDGWLSTQMLAVSASEHALMAGLISQFAAEAQRVGAVTKERLIQAGMNRPMVPEWIQIGQIRWSEQNNQSNGSVLDQLLSNPFRIICISAARTQNTPSYYVQGSAGDHELWTGDICDGGLDYKFLWDHVVQDDTIVDNLKIHSWLGDQELISRLNELYKRIQITSGPSGSAAGTAPWCDVSQVRTNQNATNIYFGQIYRNVDQEEIIRQFPNCNRIVVLSETCEVRSQCYPKGSQELDDSEGPEMCTSGPLTVQHFKVADTKVGSKKLRDILPQINLGTGARDCCTLVLCDSGKDLSAAVVLMWLCLNYDLNWQKYPETHVTKDYVKRQLALLQEVRKINPRRNSLQSVNAVVVGQLHAEALK